jgi:hypothetical protein
MQLTVILPLLAIASAGAANAEQPQRSPDQLQALFQCRAIVDSGARLQCYDTAVASLAQATETGAVVVVDRESIRRTRRSLFGLSLPNLPFLGGGGEDSDEPSEIEAPIQSARSVEYGKWVIVLEDGAVWQTVQQDTRSQDPRAGQTATIRKGSLGSYYISWPGSRTLSAKRVR